MSMFRPRAVEARTPDPLRAWVGNLKAAVPKRQVLQLVEDLGLEGVVEVAVFHKNHKRDGQTNDSSAILTFASEACTPNAIQRLNGLRDTGLEWDGKAMSARHAWMLDPLPKMPPPEQQWQQPEQQWKPPLPKMPPPEQLWQQPEQQWQPPPEQQWQQPEQQWQQPEQQWMPSAGWEPQGGASEGWAPQWGTAVEEQ